MIWEIATSLFSGIGSYVIAGLGFVAAIVAARHSGKRAEQQKQKVKDHERADEIRDRVRLDNDSSLHEYDGAGWRDD